MKVKLREENKIGKVEVGDVIVTDKYGIRIIVTLVSYGRRYGALNPETGEVYYKYENIEDILKEYEIVRVIKKDNMSLVEEKSI